MTYGEPPRGRPVCAAWRGQEVASAEQARRGRIFVDYLRNGRGSTAIAPFSTRARPGAAVAMPVAWELLEKGLAPDAYKAPEVTKKGSPEDPWTAFFKPKRSLKR